MCAGLLSIHVVPAEARLPYGEHQLLNIYKALVTVLGPTGYI